MRWSCDSHVTRLCYYVCISVQSFRLFHFLKLEVCWIIISHQCPSLKILIKITLTFVRSKRIRNTKEIFLFFILSSVFLKWSGTNTIPLRSREEKRKRKKASYKFRSWEFGPICVSFFCKSGIWSSGFRDKYHSEKWFTSWTLMHNQWGTRSHRLRDRQEDRQVLFIPGIYFWFCMR